MLSHFSCILLFAAAAAKAIQLCPTLRDLMDCSLPGTSIHGIFQARVLEWVAIAFSDPTLCDPMNYSPPGSSVNGILQARVLKWVSTPFSRGSSQPRDQTCVSSISCIGRQVLYH